MIKSLCTAGICFSTLVLSSCEHLRNQTLQECMTVIAESRGKIVRLFDCTGDGKVDVISEGEAGEVTIQFDVMQHSKQELLGKYPSMRNRYLSPATMDDIAMYQSAFADAIIYGGKDR